MLEGRQEVIVYKCEVCGREAFDFSAIERCEKEHAERRRREECKHIKMKYECYITERYDYYTLVITKKCDNCNEKFDEKEYSDWELSQEALMVIMEG